MQAFTCNLYLLSWNKIAEKPAYSLLLCHSNSSIIKAYFWSLSPKLLISRRTIDLTFKIVQYGPHSPDVSPVAFRPIKFAHFLGGVAAAEEELTVVFMLTEAKLNGGDEYRPHFALARPSAVRHQRIRVTLFRHVLGRLLICWNY